MKEPARWRADWRIGENAPANHDLRDGLENRYPA